jgi:SAM-dependent methyltransferase
LRLGTVARSEADDIREGVLVCSEPLCQREHPVVDGIPVVVADLQSWAAHQLDAVMRRQDLSPLIESLLADAAGPDSALDRQRRTLSAYARAHWGDFDCEEPLAREASLAHLLERALELVSPPPPRGMWIDLGCAVGRGTRDIALLTGDLVVGVDLNFGMLRIAERVRSAARAEFDIHRVGLVYDRREFGVPDVPSDRMSFWCCDGANLPFADGAFNGALSLNVLDCVASPVAHLLEMGRVLASHASGLLSTPYDWSVTATPLAQWLGGHSQRSQAHGSSSKELRRVLASLETGLRIEAERERVPWRVHVNERASMDYAVHLLALRRH